MIEVSELPELDNTITQGRINNTKHGIIVSETEFIMDMGFVHYWSKPSRQVTRLIPGFPTNLLGSHL